MLTYNNHGNCSYCNEKFDTVNWCKMCDPNKIIEGWTSGNVDIDKFIKDTMLKARNGGKKLEWISWDSLYDINQLYEDDFEKIYSATWMKKGSQHIKVILKKFAKTQRLSAELLDEV
jgi:hypothetical protein